MRACLVGNGVDDFKMNRGNGYMREGLIEGGVK